MEGIEVVFDASRGEVVVILGSAPFEMPLSIATLVVEKINGVAAAVEELRLLSR